MSRWEFMRQLEELLSDISPNEREEALQYYNDYFNDAGRENEQEVILALGSPGQVAQIVREGLGDSGSQGEFTENGFSSRASTASKNGLIRRGTEGSADKSGGSRAGSCGENSCGESPFKEGSFMETTSRESAGSGISGAAGPSWSGAERGSAGTAQSGTDSAGRGGFGTQQGAGSAWRESDSREGAGRSQPESGSGFSWKKKELPAWAVVLIVIGCIICSPVILGAAGSLLGILLGVFGTAFGLVFGIGLAAIILFVVAVSLLAAGFGCLFAHPFTGLGLMGGGLICGALGIFFLLFTVFLVGKGIPALCRGVSYLYHRVFDGRKGAAA